MRYLKSRKSRKYMGQQDHLAVMAAGDALASAGLGSESLRERGGLYLAVGYLPFEEEDIKTLVEYSTDSHGFSMKRFSTEGYNSVNPLLTFRCLSNMPAYHVSVNFDIQGPYFVTYPAAGQFYLALEEAIHALASGAVEYALVGGVAHQRNFLVTHHFDRLSPPLPAEDLTDAAGFLVLESTGDAERRGAAIRARLLDWSVSYLPHHPFEESLSSKERFEGMELPGETGPASLPVGLCRTTGPVSHTLESRDGICASSRWEIS